MTHGGNSAANILGGPRWLPLALQFRDRPAQSNLEWRCRDAPRPPFRETHYAWWRYV